MSRIEILCTDVPSCTLDAGSVARVEVLLVELGVVACGSKPVLYWIDT